MVLIDRRNYIMSFNRLIRFHDIHTQKRVNDVVSYDTATKEGLRFTTNPELRNNPETKYSLENFHLDLNVEVGQSYNPNENMLTFLYNKHLMDNLIPVQFANENLPSLIDIDSVDFEV